MTLNPISEWKMLCKAKTQRTNRLELQFRELPKDKPFRLMVEAPVSGRMDICLASYDTLPELQAAWKLLQRQHNGDPCDCYIEYPVTETNKAKGQ